MKRTLQLPKGLTRAEALRLAHREIRKGRKVRIPDFRGFVYDQKTGKAVIS